MTRLTPGLIARHAPRGPGGREAALIDIAQDLLLTHLVSEGLFDDLLVLKGGTALRKMYAGTAGRFSTDLDFALAPIDADRDTATELLVASIDGHENGDFSYRATEHRGKWHVNYSTRFGDIGSLTTKLDIGPPVWLPPHHRSWIAAPVHSAYALPPSLPVMALEENLAEKVARLNRVQLARDIYDLWWIGSNPPHSSFDEGLVANLAALKCWVDAHGIRSNEVSWMAVDGATPLNPAVWLSSTGRVADESIGLLMNPPPDMAELRAGVSNRYQFLRQIAPAIAAATGQDRRSLGEISQLVRDLPGSRFHNGIVLF